MGLNGTGDLYGVDRDVAAEKVLMIDGTPYDSISHWELLKDLQARCIAWLALMADDMSVVFDGPESLQHAFEHLNQVVASRLLDGGEYDFDGGMAEFFRWFRAQVDEV